MAEQESRMRTLLVLRHAKSSWKDADLADHDRPLNKRGKRDAPRIGRLLKMKRLSPDAILGSSATRARRTAEDVAAWSAFTGGVQIEPRLYLADPATIVDVVRRTEADAGRLMVVGHNPGLEQLVARLTGVTEPLPTAALVQIRLPIAHWKDLRLSTSGQLVDAWQPRTID